MGWYSSTLSFWLSTLTRVWGVATTDFKTISFQAPKAQGSFVLRMAYRVFSSFFLVNQISSSLVMIQGRTL